MDFELQPKGKILPKDQNFLFFLMDARAFLFLCLKWNHILCLLPSFGAPSTPSASLENRTILGNSPLSSLVSLLCIRWRLYIMFWGSRWEEQLVWKMSSLTTVKLRRVWVCVCEKRASATTWKFAPETVNLTVCFSEPTVQQIWQVKSHETLDTIKVRTAETWINSN